MEWVQIRKKFQITLPKSVREDLRLDEGDLLSVQVRDHELVLRPQALVDRDQAWYHVLKHGGQETYVAESNLEADASGEEVDHPLLGRFFATYANGRYYRPGLN